MKNQSITIDVSFNQLAVFSPALGRPFNDWSDIQVAQGFSWSPESVSFRTIEDGLHTVDVAMASRPPGPGPDAVRAITVPFTVSIDQLEVASISDSKVVGVEPGNYQLLCEILDKLSDVGRRVRITLERSSDKTFAVLIADGELAPPDRLVTI